MSRTLLLNGSWEPLSVLTVRRAVGLVLTEKAEVLEERDQTFGSPSFQMFEPSVVRLNYVVKVPYRARIPLNRRAVLVRDRGVCQYCFKPGDTMDHVIPRAKGGVHRWENVVCSCRTCNHKKGDRSLEEMGWVLKMTPYAPSGTHWLTLGLGSLDPLWDPYLGKTEILATA